MLETPSRRQAILKWLVPDVRGLPRAFWQLFAISLFDRLGGFVVPYLTIFLTTVRGASVTEAGGVLSLYAVGGLFGAPVGGAIADRVGRRPVLIAGSLASSVSLLLLGVSESLTEISVATFFVGVAMSLGRPAMSAAIADVVAEADRARAYGLYHWAINLGFAFAVSLAAALSSVSFHLIFLLDAATCAVSALAVFLFVRETLPTRATDTAVAQRGRGGFVVLLSDVMFLRVVFVSFCCALMFMQTHVSLAAELVSDGLMQSYGFVVAVNGVLIVLLQPTVVQLLAKRSPAPVLAASSLTIGIGFFLTAFAQGVVGHVVAVTVWSLGEIALNAIMPATVARLAPASLRATYQGAQQLTWSLAAAGPAGGALLLERGGSLALWGTCLGLGVVSAALVWPLRRAERLQLA